MRERRLERPDARFDADAAGLDRIQESHAREGQGAGRSERAEQARRDHAAVRLRDARKVGDDGALGGDADGLDHRPAVGRAVARLLLLRRRVGALARGDERRAVGRHEPAQKRTTGLHQFGGQHHVDIARRRHQGEHRRGGPRQRPDHLDIVDRGARALRHARHGRRLHDVAAGVRRRCDPVAQHAAALAAHGDDGDRDRSVGDGGEAVLCHGARPHPGSPTRPRSRRACSQPITRMRRRARRRSNAFGLCTMSAR